MKFLFIDLESSFNSDGIGFEKSIIDQEGKERLNESLWEIGKAAYDILKNGELSNVAENFILGKNSAKIFISDFVKPLMFDLYMQGRLKIEGENEVDNFENFWEESEWVDQVIYFLLLVKQQVGHISFAPKEFSKFLQQIIASAIIERIDDAVISELLDGRFLLENVEDVNFLYDQLMVSPHIEVIGREVLKLRAKKGASIVNTQHKDRQDFVFKWLDANYKDGDTHEDLASRLEPLLDGERKYGTILKDISKWKKER